MIDYSNGCQTVENHVLTGEVENILGGQWDYVDAVGPKEEFYEITNEHRGGSTIIQTC
jgi:hypothetical protein